MRKLVAAASIVLVFAFLVVELLLFGPSAQGATDTDGDGWSDADETAIGTNPLLACGPDAWPPDITDDQLVDVEDIVAILPFLFQAATGNERYNLYVDGAIDFQDFNSVIPYLFEVCETP